MAKRKGFNFDPGAWLGNDKLRRNPTLKGAWIDCICILAMNEEFGIIRYELKELAQAAGTHLHLVQQLVDRNILKGAPAGATCEPFIVTNRRGNQVILVPAQRGPIWYSSRLVRDGYVSAAAVLAGLKGQRRRQRTLKGVGAPSLKGQRRRQRTLKGVGAPSRGTLKGVGQGPSPPLSLPPTPPNPITTSSPEDDFAAQNRRRRSGGRRGTAEKPAEFRAFTDFWCHRWSEIHAPLKFNFLPEDGVQLWAVFQRCAKNLDEASKTAEAFLIDRRWFKEGHPTKALRYHVQQYRSAAQLGVVNVPGNKPTATDRGEYDKPIPLRVKKLTADAAP